jgi:ribose transport system permease protein
MNLTKRSPRFGFGLDRFSGLYLWALFIAIFGIWKPDLFLTSSTLHSIASQQAITAMVALAVLLPLAAGSYDLSVGANINLSTIIVTVLQVRNHSSMWESIFVAVLAGLAVGMVNGFLVVKLHLSSFIATLGMATIVTAVQTIVAGQSQPAPPISQQWDNLAQRQLWGFQIVFFYMLIIAIMLWWLLERMSAGRYVYAVGGNTDAARLSGVKTGKWTFLTLAGSGLLCGVIGVFYASLNGPSLTFGSSLLLPAFAAAFLGSTQIWPGRFNVWGTVIAVFVLATGVKGMQLVTGVQWLNDMFNGVALISAVAFAVWRGRRSASPKRRAEIAAEAEAEDGPQPDVPRAATSQAGVPA